MPSKKVTRRAVSIRGLIHQRVRKYCAAKGIAVSKYMEDLILADLQQKKWPEETLLEPRPRAERFSDDLWPTEGVGGIVSF